MSFPLDPQDRLPLVSDEEREIRSSSMQDLIQNLSDLEDRLLQGGGAKRANRQYKAGKMLARERIAALLDTDSEFLELGLLIAHDQYDGAAPAAGVITGIGTVKGRPVAVMANDATVKAGTWFPETVSKILRIQEVAMGCHIPVVYLVDSGGLFLPLQHATFPGKFGGARIFYNCSRMRRQLRIPQIAAVMGPCIAGGAYLPALSDVIFMVEGTSFLGLGGPNLVKGAIGTEIEGEELGGSTLHTESSGVAHYRVADDVTCIDRIRTMLGDLPATARSPRDPHAPAVEGSLDGILPSDHRLPYDMHEIVKCLVDDDSSMEFMAAYAPEILCANVRIEGWPVGLIANRRGLFKKQGQTRMGAIIYAESARKVAQFVEKSNRQGHPLVFLQDVSGFMVGPDAEMSGIIRAGAEMVAEMATTRVKKIVVTLCHASGAGYYAMAGQGFDPDFIFSWPTARVGVMDGDAAVQALFATELKHLEESGEFTPEELSREIEGTRAEYERTLTATWCAARGHVDAVIRPDDTRHVLATCLEAVNGGGYAAIRKYAD